MEIYLSSFYIVWCSVSFLTLFMHMALPKIFVIVWEDGGYKDRQGQAERKANQLWRYAHRLALLNYTCVIASLCLKWFGFCYLPSGKKKKVEKRLTFDNLCNIFSNLPCPTKGPFPDSRKFIRSESFKSLPQGQGWKCCRGERTSARGHNNFHFSSSMSDGLCHKKKMLALCYLTQLNWGCNTKINAVCSKRPHTHRRTGPHPQGHSASHKRVKSNILFGWC